MKKNTQNFEIAYSIGDTCGGALHLKKRKMRFASGPLDWLAGGDFAYRTSTIIEDFQDFMREEDLELRQRDFSQGMHFDHDYYHNIKSGIQHFHDFKTGIPLKDSYPQVQKNTNDASSVYSMI